MKAFIKENWFKLVISVAIILIGFSLFYYFVIFSSRKEQVKSNQEAQKQLLQEQEKQEKEAQLQKQAQITLETNYWNNLKQKIQESRTATNNIRSNAESQISQHRDWLNDAYLQKSNQYYYALVPLVNASEHFILTLQNLVASTNKVNSIRYEMLSAVEQRDQITLDSLATKESDAVSTMSYWINQEQKKAEELNTLKTETIKNYGDLQRG